MQLTIEKVYPRVREWAGDKGTWHYVKCLFTDNSEGEVSCKPEKSEETKAALTALIGKPGEYEVEDKGEYQGITQRKLKSWPGKAPAPGFGGKGGGGGFAQAWRNGEEGSRFEAERSDRRTALMQAVAFMGDSTKDPEEILAYSDRFYKWLRDSLSDAPKTVERVNTPIKPYFPSPANVAPTAPPVEEEPAHPRRKAFFDLWWQLDMPADTQYILWVTRMLLVALRKWPDTLPINSVEDVDEDAWGFAKTAIRAYHKRATDAGYTLGQEPEFLNAQKEGWRP